MNALLLEQQRRFEKIAFNSLYFTLALAIFSGQSMFLNNSLFASESDVVQNNYLVGSSRVENVQIKAQEEIVLLTEKNKWESSVRQKYKNAC